MQQGILKKLDRYLLTHYPFIWSTRLHWVLLIMLPVWAFFFFLGTLAEIPEYSSDYGQWFFLMSVLSAVGLVFWIILTGRHNLTKQFGIRPLLDGWLEFLIYFVCIGLITTLSMSFPLGQYFKARITYNPEKLSQQYSQLNKAMNWIFPFCDRFYFHNPIEEQSQPYVDDKGVIMEEAPPQSYESLQTYESPQRPCERDTLYMSALRSHYNYYNIFGRGAQEHTDEYKQAFERSLNEEPYRREIIEQALAVMSDWGVNHQLNYEKVMSRYDVKDNFRFRKFRPDSIPEDQALNEIHGDLLRQINVKENQIERTSFSYSEEIWRIIFYITFYLTLFFAIFRNVPRRPFVWALVALLVLPILFGIFSALSRGEEDTFYALSLVTLLIAFLLGCSLFLSSRKMVIQIMGLVIFLLMLPHFPLFTFEMLDLRSSYLDGHHYTDGAVEQSWISLKEFRFRLEWISLLLYFLLWQPVFKPLLIRANSLPEA